MKTFIMLIILFYQHEHVTSHAQAPPFQYLAQKISEFATNFAESLRKVGEKIKGYFLKPIITTEQTSLVTDEKNKNKQKAFNNYVKSVVADDPRYSEYATLKASENAFLSTPQMATLHGRKVESHAINTSDGYVLTVHRIIVNNGTTVTYKTVLLHHGLLGSSADWLLLGATKSLPYILSDAGYDVWMANARGNYYSRKHSSRKVDSDQFWNFTWQEMGEYDLPATIDYIRKVKNINESIYYVGHSVGATALLVLLSTLPVYNKYLKIGILLAPLAFMAEVNGPLKVLSMMIKTPSEQLLGVLGHHGELFPSRRVPDWLSKKYCDGPLLYCRNPLFFITGGIPQLGSRNSSFVASLLYHIPAGGSVNTLLHYAQVIKSGKFHKFDDIDSEFHLRNVTLPIAMFSSSEDWIATIPNVAKLYDKIADPIDHNILRNKNFSHTDFVWGSEANVLVFPKVLELLDNGLKINSTNMNEI